MSTANIDSIVTIGILDSLPVIVVTFNTRDFDQIRYRYEGYDALDILGGADPKDYEGELLD